MHRKTRIGFLLIALLILLCSCTKNIQARILAKPVSNSVFDPNISKQLQSVPDEAERTIDILPGTHFLRYDDPVTSDYLEYYLFVPECVEKDMPLVIFLHGDGEVGDPEKLANYSLTERMRVLYGNQFPFIVVAPCTRSYTWIDDRIPETLMGLIQSVLDAAAADPDRIIISGHSRGAIGVWHMISNYSDYFAGAIPISCGAESPMDYELSARVPVYAFAGTRGVAENSYRVSMERIVNKINANGGVADLIILKGDSHADTALKAFQQETFEWILAQKRS